MILKAFLFRIYPYKAQKTYFSKCFGCARFIWNRMLSDKEESYIVDGLPLHNTPAQYKKEYPFLKEVDSLALANVQLDLERAYKDYFKGKTNKPKFKSKKKSRNSYTTNNQNGSVSVTENSIKLPKVGYVKAKIHRSIPNGSRIKSATVSMTPSGKYYCSVLAEIPEEKHSPRAAIEEDKVIGLDYSSPHFYVDNNGISADMPHWLREKEKRLAREQRKLSRMLVKNTIGYTNDNKPIYRKELKECKNIQKQRNRIAVLHEKTANARKDWCHKKSREITNSCDAVILEDIDLRAMAQTLHLGKATNDNGFGMFRTFLTYKMEEEGKYVIKVSRTYPSSQLCSTCGHKNPEVKDLRIRKWTCPQCGTVHNRDTNAAINLKKEGIRLLQEEKVMVL